MNMKVELNGVLYDAWESGGTFFIAFDAKEFDPAMLPALYDAQKLKTELTLTIAQKE